MDTRTSHGERDASPLKSRFKGLDFVIGVQLVQRPSANALNQRRNQMIARVSIHLHRTT